MEKEKRLLFSVTKDDFEMQTFRSGGKGGGNQNARSTGVRFIHKASGARGEARDSRNQAINKEQAFLRCVNSSTFKAWHKVETMRRLGMLQDIDKRVDEMMKDCNIKIEYI
jgi:protein subunit release factor A